MNHHIVWSKNEPIRRTENEPLRNRSHRVGGVALPLKNKRDHISVPVHLFKTYEVNPIR